MIELRRIFAVCVSTGLLLTYQTVDAGAGDYQLNAGIAPKLAQCVGQFDAAEGYGSYIDSFSQSRSRANKAMSQLISGLKGADASVFINKAREAQAEYELELVQDPMRTLDNLRALMRTCMFYAQQAENISAEQAHQEALAEAALAEEQGARQQAESEKRLHEYEQQRIVLETERAKAEATRIQAQAEHDKAAEQAHAIERLEKEKAELLSKVAELKKAKDRDVAEAEDAKRALVAQNDASGNQPAALGDLSKNVKKSSAASASARKKTSMIPTNLLEAAITPGSGTQASWDEFVDEGGLNHQAKFYSLPVASVTPGYSDQGKIIGFEIVVSQLVSRKELREALNGLCGSGDDWQFPGSDKSRGNIEKPDCYISYGPQNKEYWSILFEARSSEHST